ncbi:MAG: hypothetical protein ACYS0G_09020 [Planctomycetota bacterium]|jgi:hypothetical protein
MTTLPGMRFFPAAVWVSLLAVVVLAGCTTVVRRFPGATEDHLWTALVEVAENPAYDDWKVATNEVWVDELDRRIEIYRRLRRVLRRPAAKPHSEKRTYRFQVRLEDTDPPEAVFVSRGWGVPAHALLEGEKYFADAWHRLVEIAHRTAPEADSDQDLLDALGLDDAGPMPEDKPDLEPPPPPEQ